VSWGRHLLTLALIIAAVVATMLVYDWLSGRQGPWWVAAAVIAATFLGHVWGERARARGREHG
jgi:hypothetical protein